MTNCALACVNGLDRIPTIVECSGVIAATFVTAFGGVLLASHYFPQVANFLPGALQHINVVTASLILGAGAIPLVVYTAINSVAYRHRNAREHQYRLDRQISRLGHIISNPEFTRKPPEGMLNVDENSRHTLTPYLPPEQHFLVPYLTEEGGICRMYYKDKNLYTYYRDITVFSGDVRDQLTCEDVLVKARGIIKARLVFPDHKEITIQQLEAIKSLYHLGASSSEDVLIQRA